jgi:ubiquinol-cytochrome c reductase cytochrome b subunit
LPGVVFSPSLRVLFWCFVANFAILTWLGMIPAEPPYVFVSQVATLLYFVLVILYLLATSLS